MHYLCSGKCKKVFEMLYQSFSNENDDFSFFEDGLALVRKAMSRTSEDDDMILLDYDLYKGFSDVIYEVLNSKQLKIPLISIGEPERNETERVSWWISINELKYDVQTFHTLVPVLKKISASLEDIDFHGISENQTAAVPALPLKPVKRNFIEDFRKNNALPPSIYNLLAFLYKNRSHEISIDDIVEHLNIKGNNEKEKKNEAYAYSSRLRKFIDGTTSCKVELLRTRTGYYRLFLM